MYATAQEYLGFANAVQTNPNKDRFYKEPEVTPQIPPASPYALISQPRQTLKQSSKVPTQQTFQRVKESFEEKPPQPTIKMETEKVVLSPKDPKVWGPAFWFGLHNAAAFYPEDPSPIVRSRMKDRILAIPYEINCDVCRPHAISFIEKHRDNLDSIVSSRDNLGAFYVDFHNQVNKRYGKREWTYQEALAKYRGGVDVTHMIYN